MFVSYLSTNVGPESSVFYRFIPFIMVEDSAVPPVLSHIYTSLHLSLILILQPGSPALIFLQSTDVVRFSSVCFSRFTLLLSRSTCSSAVHFSPTSQILTFRSPLIFKVIT